MMGSPVTYIFALGRAQRLVVGAAPSPEAIAWPQPGMFTGLLARLRGRPTRDPVPDCAPDETRLVWIESHASIDYALARAGRLSRWSGFALRRLVSLSNPGWRPLMLVRATTEAPAFSRVDAAPFMLATDNPGDAQTVLPKKGRTTRAG